MAKNRVKTLPLSSVDSATFGVAVYSTFDAAGLGEACFLVRITNGSNVGVVISLNGIEDHEVLLSGQSISLGVQTNSSPGGWVSLFAKTQQFFVKPITAGAGTGLIYVSGYYTAP